MLKIISPRINHRENPLGIDGKTAFFSWKLESNRTNVMQKSYQIVMAKDKTFSKIISDTGVVKSDQSINVKEAIPAVEPFSCIYWKVLVSNGQEEAVSDVAFFVTGINNGNWSAKWIDPEEEFTNYDEMRTAPYLRKCFTVKKGLKKAYIAQTAHGLYEFWVNGINGTDDRFKPGLTSYYKRIQYQVYDITQQLSEGENILSVVLGDGWWRGYTGGEIRNNFGYKLQYFGEIHLEYEDGSKEIIASDESFKAFTGGLRQSDMMLGDIFDATLEPEDWKMPGFDDSSWKNATIGKQSDADLISSESVPVREKERFTPKVFKDVNGDTVLDFGQNIAGYIEMRMTGLKKGQKVTLVHGEDIKDGAFSLSNLLFMGDRPHFQQVDYIAKGLALETYKPMFAIFGFRYVKVMGYEGKILPDTFTAIAVYSDCKQTGTFKCSNKLLNQLAQNSLWGQKGNFMDVPTDCPTRERSPWSGDAQAFSSTAMRFMDTYTFYEKWLKDMNCEQLADGRVPNTFPCTTLYHNKAEFVRRTDALKETVNGTMIGTVEDGSPVDGSVGWGDVSTIVPYNAYIHYGDKQIIENQYESAKKWVDFMAEKAKEKNPQNAELSVYTENNGDDADYYYDCGFAWGEHIEPDLIDASADFDAAAYYNGLFTNADPEVRMMFLYRSSGLVAEFAKLLGRNKDEKHYSKLHKRVGEVFVKYVVKEDGTIKKGRQAPYARALAFGLYQDAEMKQKFADKLNEAVVNFGYCMNTGFLATPFLLYSLADNGYVDTAFRVLEQTKYPSWLYPVTEGATTTLETLSGMDTHLASYNHYSFGAVCDFLFGGIAGIRPVWEKPGYKHFELRPLYGGTLTEVHCEFESEYGLIISEYKIVDDKVVYKFSIPANTTATVTLLNRKDTIQLGSGTYQFEVNR